MDVHAVKLNELPKDWRMRLKVTHDLGTAWLERKESVLLRIPSAIVPETLNCLLNPSHPQAAEFHVLEALAYPFDPRLKR